MLDEETGWFYRNDGKIVKLQEQGAKLLSVLIANKHRLVPREVLIKSIWHERFTEKANRKLGVLVCMTNKRIKGTATIKSKRGAGYIIV